MKPSKTPILFAALALTTLTALPALAGDDCQVPLDRWQPREAVQQMATSQGWTVQRLKIDDGCYELRATDAQGRRIKVKLDPESLQILKIKHKDRRHESRRERDRQGSADTNAPAAAPIFTPGAQPRAQID